MILHKKATTGTPVVTVVHVAMFGVPVLTHTGVPMRRREGGRR